MTEPSLALQKAIRARLLDTPDVLALVPDAHIRDGAARPEQFPAIIIGDGQTILEGHYPSYCNVTVHADLHFWVVEDGLEAAKTIADATWRALDRSLDVPGFDLTDGIRVEATRYMRDPSGQHGHAVMSVRALMGFGV